MSQANQAVQTESGKGVVVSLQKIVKDNTQQVIDSLELPTLIGSRKQLSWAYKIRAKYVENCIEQCVGDAINLPETLFEQIGAKYWIDNRIELIGDIDLPRTLPSLRGSDKQISYAYAIRANFAEAFPESRMLRTHTESKFWIENKKIFEFAILGLKSATDDSAAAASADDSDDDAVDASVSTEVNG